MIVAAHRMRSHRRHRNVCGLIIRARGSRRREPVGAWQLNIHHDQVERFGQRKRNPMSASTFTCMSGDVRVRTRGPARAAPSRPSPSSRPREDRGCRPASICNRRHARNHLPLPRPRRRRRVAEASGRATRRGTGTTVSVQATWLRRLEWHGSRAAARRRTRCRGKRTRVVHRETDRRSSRWHRGAALGRRRPLSLSPEETDVLGLCLTPVAITFCVGGRRVGEGRC
jgi:hypothetical protein